MNNNLKAGIKPYLPLIFLLTVFLGYLLYNFQWLIATRDFKNNSLVRKLLEKEIIVRSGNFYFIYFNDNINNIDILRSRLEKGNISESELVLSIWKQSHLFKEMRLLKGFGQNYYIISLSLVVFLIWGRFRHGSWSLYLPLVLFVAVPAIVLINISLPKEKIIQQVETDSLYELAFTPHYPKGFSLIEYHQFIKDYLEGKKLITSDRNGFLSDIRFEVIKHSDVEVKEYPGILSSNEFNTVMKNNKITYRFNLPRYTHFFLEPNGNFPKANTIYRVMYKYNHILLLPEDYFLRLKGLTMTNLKDYKEVGGI